MSFVSYLIINSLRIISIMMDGDNDGLAEKRKSASVRFESTESTHDCRLTAAGVSRTGQCSTCRFNNIIIHLWVGR